MAALEDEDEDADEDEEDEDEDEDEDEEEDDSDDSDDSPSSSPSSKRRRANTFNPSASFGVRVGARARLLDAAAALRLADAVSATSVAWSPDVDEASGTRRLAVGAKSGVVTIFDATAAVEKTGELRVARVGGFRAAPAGVWITKLAFAKEGSGSGLSLIHI